MAILKKGAKPQIDLTGPQGNAYFLIGTAEKLAKEVGKDSAAIVSEMMTGDYENLISVFDREFGDYVDLIQ